MDRPGVKNAIGWDMLRGLQHSFEAISRDSSANVLMIRSSVPKVFCAGADLKVRLSCLILLVCYESFEGAHMIIATYPITDGRE